jgi:hypothetical protein
MEEGKEEKEEKINGLWDLSPSDFVKDRSRRQFIELYRRIHRVPNITKECIKRDSSAGKVRSQYLTLLSTLTAIQHL